MMGWSADRMRECQEVQLTLLDLEMATHNKAHSTIKGYTSTIVSLIRKGQEFHHQHIVSGASEDK